MDVPSRSLNNLRIRLTKHMDSLKDPSHDGSHIRRVENNIMTIYENWAESEPWPFASDVSNSIIEERLRILALLHDCIDTKYFDGDPVEMISNLTKGLQFESINFEDEDQCKMMINIMQKARWSNREGVTKETPDYGYIAMLSDADWVDAIGAMGIFRTIAYNTLHWVPNGPTDTPMNAVGRHYKEKLSKIPAAMHSQYSSFMAKNCCRIMKEYFEKLDDYNWFFL